MSCHIIFCEKGGLLFAAVLAFVKSFMLLFILIAAVRIFERFEMCINYEIAEDCPSSYRKF